MSVNYSEVGLKVGLEVHQQLDTATKLFCSCTPQLFQGDPETTFVRRLRPTQSELGQIDPAALFEFQKGVEILYESSKETACLVEMDEEPPHNLDSEAVEIAVTVALMIGAKPVDEIHVMRKTVIDGSNTTGFQRTCVVALGGDVNFRGKKIPIQHVGLEEDAARKTGEEGSTIRYRIDRLGIPMIEVTTTPVLYSPEEAEGTALAIGKILRATDKVRRGLGTIRQDLNISIPDGALVEIKGVQELELVSTVTEREVQRQLGLIKIRDELKERQAKKENLKDDHIDVTSIFDQTKCRVIRKALEQNKQVLALRLPKFAGMLKRELAPGMRLGSEVAAVAQFWGRVGGIFHTDELPDYGITTEELDQLDQLTNREPEDAVVFVADTLENATDALKAIGRRAREAIEGVPEETRAANPDGTTRYMRPRPGAARMYPETDIPPIQLTPEEIEQLKPHLPELPEQKLSRLMKEFQINRKLASQVMNSEYASLFEKIAGEAKVSATVVAVTLTETMKALRREGIETESVADERVEEIFHLISSGKTTKEAIPEIITWLSKHEEKTAIEALEDLGLGVLTERELDTIVNDAIEQNQNLVQEKGADAFKPLMGIIMTKARGRAKAQSVSGILKKKLESMTK